MASVKEIGENIRILLLAAVPVVVFLAVYLYGTYPKARR